MGAPGPQTCAKYQECERQGDTYAGTAVVICMATPNNAWSNCVRNCLLEKYECGQSQLKNVGDHINCFGGCSIPKFMGGRGEPPPPETPRPSLVSQIISWLLG
jgi:hypothetical protein